MSNSLISLAYELVSKSKHPVPFKEIWDKITASAGLTDEEKASRVSLFYTNLIIDGRFVNLGDNTWDLRERHEYEKVHIDMTDVYSDMDEETDDDFEELEELNNENADNSIISEPEESFDDNADDNDKKVY